jgi:CRISPR-associated protein Cmr1
LLGRPAALPWSFKEHPSICGKNSHRRFRERRSLVQRIEIEVEFVTPCFLGGADNKTTAEWRGPSIRGQLRWWFRAVAGGECGGALPKVAQAEAALFGTTNARSMLQVRALDGPQAVTPAEDGPRFGRPVSHIDLANGWAELAAAQRLQLQKGSGNPIAYLGFGCMNWKGAPVRPWLAPGETARLLLQIKSPNQFEPLSKSLWAWLNLGGVGSKSRRGFGSLRVKSITGVPPSGDCLSPPGTVGDFERKIRAVLASAVAGLPAAQESAAWSHFSPDSRIFVSTIGSSSWEEAMLKAGGWLVAFRRRYGSPSDGRMLDGKAVANRDYVWAKASKVPNGNIPDRAGFGLPLPFGQAVSVTWGDEKEKRRASPLLLHIAQVGDKYFSIWTYLPADLVPPGEKLRFKADHSPAGAHLPSVEQKQIVGLFLDDLESEPKRLVRRVL